MLPEDEGPKDWEIKDEEPPERLQDRWAKEEIFGQPPLICPSCKRPVPAESLSCLFCGALVLGTSLARPGIVERFTAWCRNVFTKGSK